MAFLQSIGLALLAALLTGMAMFGGFVISIVSAIVSVILTVFGVFALIFVCLCGTTSDEDEKDKRS